MATVWPRYRAAGDGGANGSWSGLAQPRQALGQQAVGQRREAVHVLDGRDRRREGGAVDLPRRRQLEEDACAVTGLGGRTRRGAV